jgi:predicted GNAT family acetyltransferase
MKWVVETDVAAYAATVLPWLARDPVLNTVPSTVVTGLVNGTVTVPDAWLAWLDDGAGEVAGVSLCTPPYGLLVSVLPEPAIEALVATAQPELPGAAGRADVVAGFVTGYAARTGSAARIDKSLRLYRLTEPAPAERPRGRLRAATPADLDLCTRWYLDFSTDADVVRPVDPHGTSERVIAQRRLWLWEVDGTPVAMVGHTPTVAGVTRIGPVWTPAEHRRHGYATAATADVAARLRPAGEVVLFADNANPTSTGIYLRIGFRPVAEWTDWRLEY